MALPMEGKALLLRFCYLGSFEPVYVLQRSNINITKCLPDLQQLCHNIVDEEFVLIMRQLLKDTEPPRHDETMLVYAVYLSCDLQENKWRHNVRKAFPYLIRDDKDLFLFVKYAALLQNALNRRTVLNRTVRKAVCEWYQNQTLPSLVQMWTMRMRRHGFSHRIILKLCRLSDDKFDNDTVDMIRLFFESYGNIVNAAETTGVLHDIAQAEFVVNHTPRQVGEILRLQQDQQQPYHLPVGVILPVAKLRSTKNPIHALTLIRRYRLSYEQVPKQLLAHDKIVAALIPTMTYAQLLRCWRFIAQHHLKNYQVFEECRKVLNNMQKLRECNVHPVVFLLNEFRVQRRSQKQMRRALKRLDLPKVDFNYMRQLYVRSFGINKSLGLRMHITINLEDTYSQKHLLGATKRMRLHEAMVGLAFGYFMSEDVVSVNYWHSTQQSPMKIMPLQWNKDMTVIDAHQRVTTMLVKKSGQNLIAPILDALNNQHQVFDLFLAIVPTAGRSNPNNESTQLYTHIKKYRETRNSRAKYIIISLRRHRRSMRYAEKRKEHLLELCGLNLNTTKLISDFALEHFN